MLNEGLPILYITSVLRREGRSQLIRARYLDNWYIKYQIHEDCRVSAVFLSQRSSIENLHRNPYILMMDCTYKTNRYNIPLFNIIGLTPQGGTFYIAFGFILDEREGSFRYIIERLADIYPILQLQPPTAVVTDKDNSLLSAIRNTWLSTASLLCIWCINKNILSHAKWAIRDYLLVRSTPTDSAANEKEFLKQIDRV